MHWGLQVVAAELNSEGSKDVVVYKVCTPPFQPPLHIGMYSMTLICFASCAQKSFFCQHAPDTLCD